MIIRRRRSTRIRYDDCVAAGSDGTVMGNPHKIFVGRQRPVEAGGQPGARAVIIRGQNGRSVGAKERDDRVRPGGREGGAELHDIRGGRREFVAVHVPGWIDRASSTHRSNGEGGRGGGGAGVICSIHRRGHGRRGDIVSAYGGVFFRRQVVCLIGKGRTHG